MSSWMSRLDWHNTLLLTSLAATPYLTFFTWVLSRWEREYKGRSMLVVVVDTKLWLWLLLWNVVHWLLVLVAVREGGGGWLEDKGWSVTSVHTLHYTAQYLTQQHINITITPTCCSSYCSHVSCVVMCHNHSWATQPGQVHLYALQWSQSGLCCYSVISSCHHYII